MVDFNKIQVGNEMQISDVEVYDVTLTGIWSVLDAWYHVGYHIIIHIGNGVVW